MITLYNKLVSNNKTLIQSALEKANATVSGHIFANRRSGLRQKCYCNYCCSQWYGSSLLKNKRRGNCECICQNRGDKLDKKIGNWGLTENEKAIFISYQRHNKIRRL